VDSGYEPLRQRARKIVQEESAHWVHGTGWLRRLAREGHTAELETALERVWDHALTWFGRDDDSTLAPLAHAGLISAGPDALRQQLLGKLAPVLEAARVGQSLLNRNLPWQGWDADKRRLG
jgi:ring-1,2-phenylacetyl-CoA epoxidase subunit PaaA/ring-1,2-phenylacetyl-CoA epoxidase subunit PaaC